MVIANSVAVLVYKVGAVTFSLMLTRTTPLTMTVSVAMSGALAATLCTVRGSVLVAIANAIAIFIDIGRTILAGSLWVGGSLGLLGVGNCNHSY